MSNELKLQLTYPYYLSIYNSYVDNSYVDISRLKKYCVSFLDLATSLVALHKQRYSISIGPKNHAGHVDAITTCQTSKILSPIK